MGPSTKDVRQNLGFSNPPLVRVCLKPLPGRLRPIFTLFCSLRGGVHPDYFVKLDFEIAVEQQTRARDRTFEGVPDSG